MKYGNDDNDGCATVFFAGALFLLGLFIGIAAVATEHIKIRDEAIERGFAEYNPKTGEWQWKEPTE